MPINYQGSGGGIARKTAKIFALNSPDNDTLGVSEFGSKLNSGNSNFTKDLDVIQNAYYENGWSNAVISNLNYPLMSDMNGVLLVLSQQIAYILQHGLCRYDSGTTYYTYDICQIDGITYIALQDNFSNKNPQSEPTYWAVFYNPADLENKQDKLTAGYNIDINSNVISASGKYPCSFNNGNVDSSGNADLISYSGSDVSYKIGNTYPNLTGTKADGQQFEVDAIADDDVSGLADGSYKKYVGSDGSAELLNNTLSISKTEPTTPNDKDVWINNAVSPLSVKKYVAPNYTNNDATISSDGIASGFSSTKYVTANVNFPSNTASIEFYFPAITLNAGYSSFTVPLQASTNNTNIALGINNNSHTALYLWGDNNTTIVAGGTGSLTYTTGTKYYLRLVWNGISYKLERSTDNINWETDYTLTSSVPLGAVLGYVLGNNVTHASAFNGSLDLKEFKVIVDNNLLYQLDIGGWQDYDKIPLGKITVSGGAVTDVETLPYNIDYIGAGGFTPTGAYKTLTVLASGGNYTAPANGYFYFSSGDGVLQIGNNATQSLGMTSKYEAGSPAYGAKVFCPVQRGQSVFLRYSGTVENAYFIYSKDSRNEAI